MAAIEKIDEMTGEYPYPSWKMWDYKHNHIQVCPWNRKAFKGAKHVLVITKSNRQIMWKGGGTSTIDDFWLQDIEYCGDKSKVLNRFWKGRGYYIWSGRRNSQDQYLKKIRISQEYLFDLYCPDIPGEVQGHYMNWSTDLSSVKRRLKRMIGSDLNIVYVDCAHSDLVRLCAEELYNEPKD